MNDKHADGSALRSVKRVAAKADKLVALGRLTKSEAERLIAVTDGAEAEQLLREISRRHAAERLEVAAARGGRDV